MKTIIVTIALFLFQTMLACAQKISVSSFEVSQGDILARASATCRYDTNDKYCALIKVGVALDGVEFECSGGVIDVVRKTGEYWVYLPQNNSKLRVLHNDYTPLEINFYDYGIGRVESGVTYVLTLEKSVGQLHASISSNTLVIPVKNGVNVEMVRVEGGTFAMGATPEMLEPYDNERPAHQVTLTKNYYIGKYEVTQHLWESVMGNNPSVFKGKTLPVESVTWKDCHEFIKKLNLVTGRVFRLPTEAEWEYAARGGNKGKGYQYSGSDILSDVAWWGANSKQPHPVGTKLPNELGIYDMSGNVWEWVEDGKGEYQSTAQSDPIMINPRTFSKMYRGGGFPNNERNCRSSVRIGDPFTAHASSLGFRLALSELYDS